MLCMNVELITDIDTLASLEPSYSALLEKVGGIESFYYSIDHIRMSLETFRLLGASLLFIIVKNGDELAAVLPLQITRRFGGLKRTVSFIGELDFYSYNTHQKILTDGDQPEAINAAAAFLDGELGRRWDLIEFMWVKMEDANIRRFASFFPQASIGKLSEQYYHYETRHDLDAHLGSKQMGNLRRRRRRLTEDFGAVEFVVKEDLEPADLEEFRKLHSARHNFMQNGGAIFEDEFEREHIEKMFALWNRTGRMHFYALCVNGKTIAARIMLHAAQVTLGYMMAFDMEYSRYAPMRILSYDAFRHEKEHYATERIETNWSTDTNRQKRDYSSGRYDLFDIRVVNRRRSSRISIALIKTAGRFVRFLKSYIK